MVTSYAVDVDLYRCVMSGCQMVSCGVSHVSHSSLSFLAEFVHILDIGTRGREVYQMNVTFAVLESHLFKFANYY